MQNTNNQVLIVPFSKAAALGVNTIGAKGANLAKLVSLRVPVPNGFILTTDAFTYYCETTGLEDFIRKELNRIDPSDTIGLENVAKRIRNGILKVEISSELRKHIGKAYATLSGFSDAYVAVRSSSILEDAQGDSFAGMHSTYLNIRGKEGVIEKVRNTWASLYSPQTLFYASSRGYDIRNVRMAVVVQKMIQAEASGVMFTVNPIDNDATKISIEAILGLGEALVSGELTPDSYLVDKETGEVIEKRIVPQEWMTVRKGRVKRGEDPNTKVKVGEVWRTQQKLENKYIERLVKVGKALEEYFGSSQDIEWVYEGGKLWIVQTRPVTTLKIRDESWKETPTFAALKAKVESSEQKNSVKIVSPKESSKKILAKNKKEMTILLEGRGTNGGMVSGAVRVIRTVSDLGVLPVKTVLVAKNITTAFDGMLGGVIAIITDEESKDSYATVVAKSLGVPCIVGTEIATKILKDNEQVTVNADKGEVLDGGTNVGLFNAERVLLEQQARVTKGEAKKGEKPILPVRLQPSEKPSSEVIRTATKIYTRIDEANGTLNSALLDTDGVGLLNPESTILSTGIHPHIALSNAKKKEEFISALSVVLFKIANAFQPQPVIYKLSNLSTSEYLKLDGGSEFETSEDNPMLGMRGANRFISNPEELALEIEAIRIVRNIEKLSNVWLAFPFIRTISELREMKHLTSTLKFRRSTSFKLFACIDLPSVAAQIEELLALEIDGVIINTDNLYQYLFGIDGGNPRLQGDYSLEDPAMLKVLEKVIKTCHKYKVKSILTGEFITMNNTNVKWLIEHGISGVCTAADRLDTIKELVVSAEREQILQRRK